jgi:hypothetical protein
MQPLFPDDHPRLILTLLQARVVRNRPELVDLLLMPDPRQAPQTPIGQRVKAQLVKEPKARAQINYRVCSTDLVYQAFKRQRMTSLR